MNLSSSLSVLFLSDQRQLSVKVGRHFLSLLNHKNLSILSSILQQCMTLNQLEICFSLSDVVNILLFLSGKNQWLLTVNYSWNFVLLFKDFSVHYRTIFLLRLKSIGIVFSKPLKPVIVFWHSLKQINHFYRSWRNKQLKTDLSAIQCYLL